MEDKQLYTTQEVADAMNVSDAYVRQMIATGKAHPLQQIGRTWVFTRDELERLRTNRKPPGRPKKQ
jgi:excisionase family DNA binding protein